MQNMMIYVYKSLASAAGFNQLDLSGASGSLLHRR